MMTTEWPPLYEPTYMPSPQDVYWKAELETMDPDEREQTVVLPKLRAQMAYAYKKSSFYKRKWNDAGIKPEDIRSL